MDRRHPLRASSNLEYGWRIRIGRTSGGQRVRVGCSHVTLLQSQYTAHVRCSQFLSGHTGGKRVCLRQLCSSTHTTPPPGWSEVQELMGGSGVTRGTASPTALNKWHTRTSTTPKEVGRSQLLSTQIHYTCFSGVSPNSALVALDYTPACLRVNAGVVRRRGVWVPGSRARPCPTKCQNQRHTLFPTLDEPQGRWGYGFDFVHPYFRAPRNSSLDDSSAAGRFMRVRQHLRRTVEAAKDFFRPTVETWVRLTTMRPSTRTTSCNCLSTTPPTV